MFMHNFTCTCTYSKTVCKVMATKTTHLHFQLLSGSDMLAAGTWTSSLDEVVLPEQDWKKKFTLKVSGYHTMYNVHLYDKLHE